MKKIYFHEEGIVPEIILAKFEELISKNHREYHNDKVQYERIETEELVYRLKFEPFVDPTFILINVLEFREFKKN